MDDQEQLNKNTGKLIDTKMQEVLHCIFIEFEEAFAREVLEELPKSLHASTKELLIGGISNLIVQFAVGLFGRLPPLFPGYPIHLDYYKDAIHKAIKDSLERVAVFYYKHQKKDELIQFLEGAKPLNPDDVKPFKDLH